MRLFSLFRSLLNRITQSQLPTRQLTGIYSRVRYHLPDLDEEMACLVAAKLYMQRYLETNKVDFLDLVVAYKLGTSGFCGTSLNQMKRHDYALSQDQTSTLTRWVMQMEFLMLSADLKRASPGVLAELLIQSKGSIRSDIEKTLTEGLNEERRQDYDQLVYQFSQAPTYEQELEKISYAIEQVQTDDEKGE